MYKIVEKQKKTPKNCIEYRVFQGKREQATLLEDYRSDDWKANASNEPTLAFL